MDLSAALKSCRKKKGIRETWSAFCVTGERTRGSLSSELFYKFHILDEMNFIYLFLMLLVLNFWD